MADEATNKPTQSTPETTQPKPEKSKGGIKSIDWGAVKRAYLTTKDDGTFPTIKELAEKFDVSMSLVGQHSTDEGWIAARKELEQKKQEAFEDEQVKLVAQANDRHLKTWQSIQGTLLRALNLETKALTRYEQFIEGKLELKKDEPKPYKPRSDDMKNLTESLNHAIKGERVVLGLPNEISKAEVTNTVRDERLSDDDIKAADEIRKRNNHGRIPRNDKPAGEQKGS